jgi:hypothetical protein
MRKQYYTERDIEDMVARGNFNLVLNDNDKLTALAYEKAQQLGVTLVQPDSPPPSTSVRPYLSEPTAVTPSRQGAEMVTPFDEALRNRIRSAVKAKFGDQINPDLLETIINRVLDNIGVG